MSLLSLTAVVLEAVALVAFALVGIGAFVANSGAVFQLFADRAEHRSGQLLGLVEYSMVAALLAAGTVVGLYPAPLFTGTVMLVGIGYLGAELAKLSRSDRVSELAGFITLGVVAYSVGHLAVAGSFSAELAVAGTLAMAGALAGALIRSAVWARHDGLMMLGIAGFLLVLYYLPFPDVEVVALAIGASIVLAYLAMLIGVASVTGMATGVLMVFLTVVFGGLVWVTMLVAFFGIGGLATKYRYTDKRARGVAEANRGARGTGNVLGNTLVALVAVLGYAAVDTGTTAELAFTFAFAGALATALADTLSSEIGSLRDDPLLITTFDRVAPGTDGAVTMLGTVAGASGAAVIAAIFVGLGPIGVVGGVIVIVAGTIGMLVDSLLGAVVEGQTIGNHGINAAATLAGAVLAAVTPYAGIV